MQLASLAHPVSGEPIDIVYSSDLRRASATAQAIAAVRESRRWYGRHCGRLISGNGKV